VNAKVHLNGHEHVDRLIQGNPDVLIENGVINGERLKKELITMSEFESAAHKQGFGSLDDIERAILEPGGTICFIGKKPTPETERHDELLARLEEIAARLGVPAGTVQSRLHYALKKLHAVMAAAEEKK
jgi:uncharacterized membrane protein YcaP (DUF421 family)